MQRDKKGRFVKKAQKGTSLNNLDDLVLWRGKYYKLKPEFKGQYPSASEGIDLGGLQEDMGTKLESLTPIDISSILSSNNTSIPPLSNNSTESQTNQTSLTSNGDIFKPFSAKLEDPSLTALKRKEEIRNWNLSFEKENSFGPKKIRYIQMPDGGFSDEFGNQISMMDTLNKDYYIHDPIGLDIFYMKMASNPKNFTSFWDGSSMDYDSYQEMLNRYLKWEKSHGINFIDRLKNGDYSKIFNKDLAANLSELLRTGLGISLNNKIAKRSLDGEIPFLQDPLEMQRSVYGNYRALAQSERNAAQLRNLASKPQTSDGALLQQMMLDAQSKAQEYINLGLQLDDALIKQTKENALAQNQQNQQLRLATVMANRQAMLKTNANKINILNTRDSTNFSQIIDPLLANKEALLKTELKQQRQNELLFKDHAIKDEVWYNYSEGLTEDEKILKNIFLTNGSDALNQYVKENGLESTLNSLYQKLNNEIYKRKAALRGVYINAPSDNFYKYYPWFKKGGAIYKARLIARSKDKDRNAKAIESSKKIAARFIEKAMNSLYTYDSVDLIAKPSKSKKYQAGGAIPFIGVTPVNAATPTTSTTSSNEVKKNSSKDDGLTSKDLIELLSSSDLLPSDLNIIITQLLQFLVTSESDPLGLDSTSNIASRYLSILEKIKNARANKEWYDKAYDKLRNEGSLNEYAVDSAGNFIGMNQEGDFERFSVDEITSGKTEGYQILTNSNLLDIRARYNNAAFNSNLIMEAANGISMNQIVDYINKTILNLGSDKNENLIFGNQSKEVIQGLKYLQDAAKEVGLDLSIAKMYEANIINESQARQAQLALSYLYNTLPSNMKALLVVKTGSKEGAEQLINNLVNSKLSSTTKIEFSPKNTGGKSGSGSKSSDITVNGIDLSPAQILQQGYGNRESIIIQDATSTGLKVEAVALPITTGDNKPMGSGTLEDVSTSQYGGILDFTNASMGGQIIPFEGRRNVAVDGSKIYAMSLPVDLEELAKGNIVPDIALIDKVNAVNRIIRELQITDPNEINAKFTEAGLPVYVNEDGSIISNNYCRFGVINGTVLDNAFGEGFVANKYLKEVDDENIINGAISIMNEGRSKEDRIEFDAKGFFNFGGLLGDYDSMYQGTIFIPISDDVFTGIATSKQSITSNEANQLQAKQDQREKLSKIYKNPGQLL